MEQYERYSVIGLTLQEFLLALSRLTISTYTKTLPSNTELRISDSSLLYFIFTFYPEGFSWDSLPLFSYGLLLPLAVVFEVPLSGAEMAQ